MQLILLTAFTLVAFAGNSLLCRMALGEGHIDPVSFTTLRLVSGALLLLPLARLAKEPRAEVPARKVWFSGAVLFVYALCFSLAYVSLDAGTGALLLFGTVQVTMIGAALVSGERLNTAQVGGLVLALAGLVTLVAPGVTAPDPLGAALMGVSGLAWGGYSVRGRGSVAPIATTASNFAWAVPLALLGSLVALPERSATQYGVLLALASGGVTSGLGYVLWYRALRSLSTTQASVVQLLVPVIAALGGVVLLAEALSTRLVVASAMTLGGVAVVVLCRTRAASETRLERGADRVDRSRMDRVPRSESRERGVRR